VERVALRIQGIDLVQECHVMRVSVVDRSGGITFFPPGSFGRLHCFKLSQDLILLETLGGEVIEALELIAVRSL
jgi:hypothetical protein